MIQAVLVDIAGVLYDGAEPIPGSVEAIDRLQDGPTALRFVTNTSQQSPAQVRQKLEDLGFAVGEGQLFTAPAAISSYLRRHDMKCHALVHPNLDDEFRPYESDTPDAVVIADAGERFDYPHLNTAFKHLMHGAQLIAIGDNRYFKKDGELVLDAGPFVRALAYAADTAPMIVGKPSADFFRIVVDSVSCKAGDALMIGDDMMADCAGALSAGLQACLVRTGKYREGDEGKCPLPGLKCAADLREALAEFRI